MMNVLQIQDNLKNFSEDQLIREMQQPSGSAPQFLVLSELNRRRRVKGDLEARQAQQQPTVAEEVVASAGVPQSQMMGMPEAMAPQSAVSDGVGTSAPMKMASGGLVQFGNDIRNSMSEQIDPYLEEVENEAEAKFNIDLDQGMQGGIMQLPGPRIPTFPRPSIGVGIGGKGFARPEPAFLHRGPRGPMEQGGQRDVIQPAVMNPISFRNSSFASPLRGYAEGGVVRAANGLSLADKNLNPGNIRPAGFFGETGSNKGYATYASPEFGLRSIAMLSDKYAKDYGIGTVNDFIEKYAPKADDNVNNKAYAKMVADSLGVDPDEQIDFTDDNVKKAIIPAISKFEGYSKDIDPDMLNRAIAGSKETDDESKVNELLSGVDSFSGSGLPALTKGVPKGVRPDFNINSVPKNIREKKYLEQLKREQLKGKEQKRPILSDILEKNVKEDQKKPSVINEIISQEQEPSIVGDDFGPALDMVNKQQKDYGPAGLDRPDLNWLEKFGRSLGGEAFGVPGEILHEAPYGSFPRPYDEADEMMGDISKIGEGLGSNYEEFIKKNFPEEYKKNYENKPNLFKPKPELTDEAKNVLEENEAIIGDTTPQVMNLIDQVRGITDKKLTKPDIEQTNTAFTSLEQELLNRQNQLQKDRDFDKYMALAQAGLSIMSSDKPTLAGAIGEGGTEGLAAFRDAQKRYQEGLTDILNARVKLADKKTGLTQKDAITAISSIDSDIAKYRTEIAKAIDPAEKKAIQDAIAQLEFQKERLLPTAGFSRLSMNVSDSAAK